MLLDALSYQSIPVCIQPMRVCKLLDETRDKPDLIRMYLQYRNDISHKIILKMILSQNSINNEQNKHVSSFIVYAYNSFSLLCIGFVHILKMFSL